MSKILNEVLQCDIQTFNQVIRLIRCFLIEMFYF